MKIKIEATKTEMEEMGADSVEELTAMLRHQLDEGVCGDAGEVVSDWLATYELDVIVSV